MDLSILDNFQVIQSPVSSRCLNFDEFHNDSTPLQATFCRQLTEVEYDAIGETETEKALKALTEHLGKDPTSFYKLMRKRKVEEMENAGLFSMLKCKVMTKLKGEEYADNWLNKDECERRLHEMVDGMMVVHNYSKETRRRCSQRLVESRQHSKTGTADMENGSQTSAVETPFLRRRALHTSTSQSSAAPPPPPPPPPPLLPALSVPLLQPLKELNQQKQLKMKTVVGSTSAKLKRNVPTNVVQSKSAISVHQELISCDPITRLRSTQVPRSPGGTPTVNPSKLNQSAGSLNNWSAHLDSPEPLHAALLRVINHKFRNVHSPGTPQSPEPPFSP